MYAVVKTGGKQYRVEQGQRLRVERVGEPDSTVELPAVLLVDGDNVIAGDDAAKATVSARVVDEGRGRKIDRRLPHGAGLQRLSRMARSGGGARGDDPAVERG